MKKSNFLLALFAVAMGLSACENASQNPEHPVDEPKIYNVKLDLSGEINVSQNPLTRIEIEDNDLIGVTIQLDNTIPYAYGLFDNLEDITIGLSSDHEYKFIVQIIEDGKEKLGHEELLDGDITYFAYGSPFRRDNGGPLDSRYICTPVTNEFVLSGSGFWGAPAYDLADGRSHHEAKGLNYYYGEVTYFVPSEDNLTASVYMKHNIYGLRIEVGQFFDEGTIKATLSDKGESYLCDLYEFTPDNRIVEDTYAHYWGGGYYNTDDLTKLFVDRDVTFEWTKADGSVVTWRTERVRFNRLKQTVIKLEKAESEMNNGIVLTYENIDIESGYNEHIVGDDPTDIIGKN